MTDLLSQLERATEGSRELSDQVLLACGWEYEPKRVSRAWYSPDGTWQGFKGRPDPSRNLQDAVSLALSMGATSVRLEWRIDALAKVMFGFPWDDGVPFYDSGSTPALAASAALVKAHESTAEAA